MTFQPVVPFSGYSGWLFLERTGESQQQAFNESVPVKRITDAFRERIGTIQTAEDLMKDRELLSVALGAFGLDDDINNTFFIQKILEEGTSDPEALANRLADPRYANLSEAFGFGTGLTLTGLSFFADDIIDRYEARQFEKAVGQQNNDLRLALNVDPALDDLLDTNSTNDGRWFGMMGNAPLREVFQTALGFPSSFATLDLDKQLEQFKERAESTFGTSDMGEIASAEKQEDLIRLFLLRSEASSAAIGSTSIALTLLQQI
ncbi:DUF1217 domain-containing protein [Pseudooctadecabacter jejudonensis]|uniref:Flagellar protein n=1 Tax=Pseudooctadecabacter jejudonensis TaxID=1391910 RepID=A0A1Y5S4X5_9RHOB|nr:DUF1217 domain-containing protein [Pseudooctadecabacter jejudonensis]SLN31775.1 hypothetical protein PSJ8397_01480 [Pseudooctadecabacter jejudonensis]